MITQEYLKSAVHYDPETGVFTWLSRPDKELAWNNKLAGKIAGWDKDGYRQIAINNKKFYSHRLAWLYMTGKMPREIDHIDMDKSNNKFANLREVTSVQNQLNRRKHRDNKSGYKGVFFSSQKRKWQARIAVNKKDFHLGFFKTPELAHAAYCKAAKKYHGEFARVA
jgi:hypothetical protein